MEYKIYYAKLNLTSDIGFFLFQTKESVVEWVMDIALSDPNRVFLVAIQEEVFITDNAALVVELFENTLNAAYPYFEGDEIFIQEYNSFEEAYKVALDMKETSPLCYAKDVSGLN